MKSKTPLSELEKLNPRYVAYALAHNREPEEMKDYDAEKYPAQPMANFLIWIQGQWSEWEKINGYDPLRGRSKQNHKEFDLWLNEKFCK